VSLAHHGVLFLDELPEFRRTVLEALRQPLEEGSITISRVRGSLTLPASFQLVAAMNPCPCGGGADGACRCSPQQAFRYRSRVSRPLLDRVDLHVEVKAVPWADLAGCAGEGSADVARRIAAARERQMERAGGPNCRLSGEALRGATALEPEAEGLLASAMRTLHLSARAHDRLRRVARTVADLAGTPRVAADHLAEALHFRRCEVDTPE